MYLDLEKGCVYVPKNIISTMKYKDLIYRNSNGALHIIEGNVKGAIAYSFFTEWNPIKNL